MSIIGNFYGLRGYLSHTRNNLGKAETLYQKGIKLGMDKPNYKLAYGVLLLKKGEFEKAREIFSNVLLTAPPKGNFRVMAKLNLALAYWKLDQIDTAVEMLWEVYRKYRNGRVYGALGYLLIEKGNLQEALKFNLEALDYDDEDPVILDNLAQTYYKLGNREEAKKYFEMAEGIKGDQADTLYYLGCIYQEEGQLKIAKEKFEKALGCNITPLSTVSCDQIKKRLQELG